MSEYVLPTIEHATVTLNEWDRVVIQMDEGWVFYRLDEYPEGTPADEYCYYTYGVYGQTFDFSLIVVVAESDVPADQIFGKNNEETI